MHKRDVSIAANCIVVEFIGWTAVIREADPEISRCRKSVRHCEYCKMSLGAMREEVKL